MSIVRGFPLPPSLPRPDRPLARLGDPDSPVAFTMAQRWPRDWRAAVLAASCCPVGGCKPGSALVFDHCHDHGWVRAVVCAGHNLRLGQIDAVRHIPGASLDLGSTAVYGLIVDACPGCRHAPEAASILPEPAVLDEDCYTVKDLTGKDLAAIRRVLTRAGPRGLTAAELQHALMPPLPDCDQRRRPARRWESRWDYFRDALGHGVETGQLAVRGRLLDRRWRNVNGHPPWAGAGEEP